MTIDSKTGAQALGDTPENKSTDGQPHVPPAPAGMLVIFGGMGDLAKRLLMPSLINMRRLDLIDDGLSIVGVDIAPGDDATLRKAHDDFHSEQGGEGAIEKGAAWQALRQNLSYVSGDFTKDDVYTALKAKIAASTTGNATFYLAVPPRFFGPIVEQLARTGLMQEAEGAFRRIAIEKPFGHDMPSAKALNARILACVQENQVYRIDHFLGKETVQNIMTARFANTMISRLWTSDAIDHMQITAAETVDVGMRGGFYDATGALRDMVPNHLFQLLAMVAMEPPNSLDPEAIRDEKAKVLKAIRRYGPEDAAANGVRGAYMAGSVDGKELAAYTDVDGVAADSRTETYVALKLMVDTWRWAGVPFYLRTGKTMAVRDTEIIVTFKPVPFAQFPGVDKDQLPPNRLVIQIQPNEGIDMDVLIKRPGLVITTVPVSLKFHYADSFNIAAMTGYESLLYDLFIGDQTLFQRADMIEAGWAGVQPFLDAWANDGAPEPYAPGSLGPHGADALIARDGHQWHALIEDSPHKR